MKHLHILIGRRIEGFNETLIELIDEQGFDFGYHYISENEAAVGETLRISPHQGCSLEEIQKFTREDNFDYSSLPEYIREALSDKAEVFFDI